MNTTGWERFSDVGDPIDETDPAADAVEDRPSPTTPEPAGQVLQQPPGLSAALTATAACNLSGADDC